MSSSDQEERRNVIIRSMFVNLQPLNSSQRETAEKVYSRSPPTPELTVEYIRLRNNDDAVTEPEALENYIKKLGAESEAKRKNPVHDDISTDELEENDDATDILENRSCEEVRRRTASWEYSPIQRLSDSPRHPALHSKSPSKHQRVTYSSQTHYQSPVVSKSPSELQQMTDSSRSTAMRQKLSKSPSKYEPVTDSNETASTPDQQTNLRRSSRIRKKVEFRPVNLSITPQRLSTSRQSRQKKVSSRPKFRRTVNTRTIGTQTVDYWFSMLMNISCEYDIIPRQQA